jgi:hypothetical protein
MIQISRRFCDGATDASGGKGIGGVYRRLVFSERIPSRHKSQRIDWKERFAVLHAFLLWHDEWQGAIVGETPLIIVMIMSIQSKRVSEDIVFVAQPPKSDASFLNRLQTDFVEIVLNLDDTTGYPVIRAILDILYIGAIGTNGVSHLPIAADNCDEIERAVRGIPATPQRPRSEVHYTYIPMLSINDPVHGFAIGSAEWGTVQSTDFLSLKLERPGRLCSGIFCEYVEIMFRVAQRVHSSSGRSIEDTIARLVAVSLVPHTGSRHIVVHPSDASFVSAHLSAALRPDENHGDIGRIAELQSEALKKFISVESRGRHLVISITRRSEPGRPKLVPQLVTGYVDFLDHPFSSSEWNAGGANSKTQGQSVYFPDWQNILEALRGGNSDPWNLGYERLEITLCDEG